MIIVDSEGKASPLLFTWKSVLLVWRWTINNTYIIQGCEYTVIGQHFDLDLLVAALVGSLVHVEGILILGHHPASPGHVRRVKTLLWCPALVLAWHPSQSNIHPTTCLLNDWCSLKNTYYPWPWVLYCLHCCDCHRRPNVCRVNSQETPTTI